MDSHVVLSPLGSSTGAREVKSRAGAAARADAEAEAGRHSGNGVEGPSGAIHFNFL